MPGVFRPYTLIDVLGVINQQAGAQQADTTISGLGFFAEADETVPAADQAAALAAAPRAWDQEVWGGVQWG